MSGAACWLPAVPMISPGHQVRTLQDSGKAAPRRHTHCSKARRIGAKRKASFAWGWSSSALTMCCFALTNLIVPDLPILEEKNKRADLLLLLNLPVFKCYLKYFLCFKADQTKHVCEPTIWNAYSRASSKSTVSLLRNKTTNKQGTGPWLLASHWWQCLKIREVILTSLPFLTP